MPNDQKSKADSSVAQPEWLRIAASRSWLLPVLFFATTASGQWLTQTVELNEGWNGVYLQVDASYDRIDELIEADLGNTITEIWQWNAPGSAQFYEFPGDAVFNVSGWRQWKSGDERSELHQISGGSAYLVRSTSDYSWQIKGRPVITSVDWSLDGVNLVGFPVDASTPPDFETFFSAGGSLLSASTEIYRYQGDSLSSNNPVEIPSALYRHIGVERGEAYWINTAGGFNDYSGPLEVLLGGREGIQYNERVRSASFWIRNRTAGSLDVELELLPSEPAPAGEPVISGQVPLLLRGERLTNSLHYSYEEVVPGQVYSWGLNGRDKEASEVHIVLGLDQLQVDQSEGDVLAGLLRIADSTGHTEQYIGIQYTHGIHGGLWVGEALVTQVGQYLKTYESGAAEPILFTNGNTVVTNDLIISEDGHYVVSGVDTSITDVPKWFPLRLIVHEDADEKATLLQRVFIGSDEETNRIVAVSESLLDPDQLAGAARISSVHLPWSPENEGWVFDGSFSSVDGLLTAVPLNFNDHQSNPFLHTYHPDHDNLNDGFDEELTQGRESYGIERTIRLHPDPPGTNFSDRISADDRMYGMYEETIRMTGLARPGNTHDVRTFEVKGVYRLDRLNRINELKRPLP